MGVSGVSLPSVPDTLNMITSEVAQMVSMSEDMSVARWSLARGISTILLISCSTSALWTITSACSSWGIIYAINYPIVNCSWGFMVIGLWSVSRESFRKKIPTGRVSCCIALGLFLYSLLQVMCKQYGWRTLNIVFACIVDFFKNVILPATFDF